MPRRGLSLGFRRAALAAAAGLLLVGGAGGVSAQYAAPGPDQERGALPVPPEGPLTGAPPQLGGTPPDLGSLHPNAGRGGRVPVNAITASAGELRRALLVPGNAPLNDDPTSRTLGFELDLLYNIKVWHLAYGMPGLCGDKDVPVRSVALEGFHLFDTGAKGIAYYTVGFAPNDDRCGAARMELDLVRLINGDWYAPDWGRHLVRRR